MDKRIKEIRSEYHLSQEEFAKKIKRKQPTVAGYESGKKIPDSAIFSICKAFPSINEDWLRTGVGEMKLNEAKDDGKRIAHLMQGMNERQKKLFRFILDMPDELLSEIISYLEDSIK